MITATRIVTGQDVQTYAEAGVAIPSLNVHGYVQFLVDTGATATVLHPADWQRLGITPEAIADAPQTRLGGIGGSAAFHTAEATVTFDDPITGHQYAYPVTICLAVETDYNYGLPSLVGMDVMRNWISSHLDISAGLVYYFPL